MQLGILVDRPLDPHQQSLRLERGEVGLEIERRTSRRSGGSARVGTYVEHDFNLCFAPLYDRLRLQCNAFSVSFARRVALIRD
jgi:hypothetical protein